jgi:hypothetical protein
MAVSADGKRCALYSKIVIRVTLLVSEALGGYASRLSDSNIKTPKSNRGPFVRSIPPPPPPPPPPAPGSESLSKKFPRARGGPAGGIAGVAVEKEGAALLRAAAPASVAAAARRLPRLVLVVEPC